MHSQPPKSLTPLALLPQVPTCRDPRNGSGIPMNRDLSGGNHCQGDFGDFAQVEVVRSETHYKSKQAAI